MEIRIEDENVGKEELLELMGEDVVDELMQPM